MELSIILVNVFLFLIMETNLSKITNLEGQFPKGMEHGTGKMKNANLNLKLYIVLNIDRKFANATAPLPKKIK